jgi:mannose-6-phosphate isomerase-like protein (cupin superfamily)
MHRSRVWGFAAGLALAGTAFAQGSGKAVIAAKGDIKWSDAGIPGVTKAPVDGDMAKGASHFFWSYPAGFVTPVHHHSADHYVTTISGNLVLIVDGKEHPLPPGSFFALTGKVKHSARCESKEPCVMFIDARGPWDAVPEADAKH